jgi:TPR repeat protein
MRIADASDNTPDERVCTPLRKAARVTIALRLSCKKSTMRLRFTAFFSALLTLAACLGGLAPALAALPAGQEAFEKSQYIEARKELGDLAAQGDGEAMAIMGEMLMRGLGGSRDELKARDYIPAPTTRASAGPP